jgi:predicted Zn-dependent peptidase
MQIIAGGRKLTYKKILADVDRSSDSIIRLTQLDYSIDEFKKIQDELFEKRKEMEITLAYRRDLLDAHKASGNDTPSAAEEVIIAMRPYGIKYESLKKEEKQIKKALKNKYIKYREAYEKKANRTETQIKKCEKEKEKLLKDNLEPKIYEQYRKLKKALDGLYSCLDEHNFKAHTPLEFL